MKSFIFHSRAFGHTLKSISFELEDLFKKEPGDSSIETIILVRTEISSLKR